MLTKNLALLALDAMGGTITGKTLFMKKIYFLGVLLNRDLGFFPHYYGPYSEDVSTGITQLKNLELIQERSQTLGAVNSAGFEMRRYLYSLTDEGRDAVRSLKALYPQEAEAIAGALDRIRQAGELDYVDLSVAAKAYMILRQTDRALTGPEVAEEARSFSWTVDDRQVQRAANFLERLDLISAASPA